jgi:DNA-directed RNA polymerase subunit K/omega
MSKKKIQKVESEEEISENIEETFINEEEEEIFDNDDKDELENYNEEEELVECQLDKLIDEDNEYYDNFENSEVQDNNQQKILKGNDRISTNRLTKYEMVRILGERTKQLTMGAKPLIKNYELLSYEKIAIEELKLNMIPFKIKRPLPNGHYEIWYLDELYKDHLLLLLE